MPKPKLWARYPRPKHQQIRDIILQNGIGAVASCDSWSLYEDMDPGKPDWGYIDERLESIPDGYPVHFHPILTRVKPDLWAKFLADLKGYVYPVLERYQGKIERVTIANEVLLISKETQWAIINLMEGISKDFPEYKLWIGEYGMRSNQRVSGTGGIIECIYELKAASPTFEGIVCIDYLDLSHSYMNQFFLGLASWLPITQSWLDKNGLNPQTIPDWIHAIETRYKAYAAPQKLGQNIAKIAETGIKIALETSVYTGPEPGPYIQARQALAYKLLDELCTKHNAELWQWNICDLSTSMTWDRDREKTDCPGYWDRDGNLKDWAVNLVQPQG